MADVVLSALLGIVFEKLTSPLLQDFGYVRGLRNQMDRLRSTVFTIQAVLHDAENSQFEDMAIRVWLTKLKIIAYDADNLLTEFMAEALQLKVGLRASLRTQVRNFFTHSNSIATRIRMGRRLRSIRETLEIISQERSSFRLSDQGVIDPRRRKRTIPETGSFVIESDVFGREGDRDKIIELLLIHHQSDDVLSVIPIVGMVGIGKTTLAQLVYNDIRLESHFDLKLWVCVSHDFDLREVVEAIIQSATKRKCDDNLQMDVLQSQLRDLLQYKTFLLVLDDIWNEDHHDWEKLINLLRTGQERSKVILTTRCLKVAMVIGTIPPHHLGGLSEDDCWALFIQRAFGRGEEGNYPNLVAIGRLLVEKCGGLPLAAKTLGGLMRFKRDETERLLESKSEIWDLLQCDDGFLSSLKLSYDLLPPPLKACFAFCSIFPRNYEIDKEKLIHLWMAEDLILQPRGYKAMEDIGNDYFNELLWRFFFQDTKAGEDGKLLSCKMAGMFHYLAEYVKGHEYTMVNCGHAPRNFEHAPHSSLISNFELQEFPEALSKVKNLRTLVILFPRADFREVPPHIFTSSRYLRVLDLSECGIQTLPESLGGLKCLRYLDLSHTHLLTLPSCIGNLCNLQTLNLFHCYDLVELPSTTRCLISLRYLNIKGCEKLTRMPIGMGELRNLQTLPVYIVGIGVGESIKELQGLNVRGELNIKNLENVKDVMEAITVNLKEKQHIYSLGLYWGQSDGFNNLREQLNFIPFRPSRRRLRHISITENSENVIEYLQPNSNLKRLFIKGYNGNNFPSWIRDSGFPNLSVVVLLKCTRCDNLPTLGKLPLLKFLHMNGLDTIQKIGHEFYGDDTSEAFPTLKELIVEDFPSLEEWQHFDERGHMRFLGKLIIKNCPKLTNMPLLPSLNHLELQNSNLMLLTSIENLSSLTILVIDTFPDLVHLPQGFLRSNSLLKSLVIRNLPNLQSLPHEFMDLLTLNSLAILQCDSLSSLPHELQHLTSLTSLEIS